MLKESKSLKKALSILSNILEIIDFVSHMVLIYFFFQLIQSIYINPSTVKPVIKLLGTKNEMITIIIEIGDKIPTVTETIILLFSAANPVPVEETHISPIKRILLYQKISVSLLLFKMEKNHFVDNEFL